MRPPQNPPGGCNSNNQLPLLVRVIDGCLLTLLFAAPLLMGGRHPVGYFAWMVIASILGLATLMHYRAAKPSAGDYIWMAAVGLVILQLIPLPPGLLLWLNPGLAELLPGLADPAGLPLGSVIYGNRPISINPYNTRLALGMLLAYGVIFHAVTRRVQTTADLRRLLAWAAVATVWIALIALAQKFVGNGKFLWIYQHISRDASDVVKGPFQNQNHLAQLMALGFGPLLYFATSRSGPRRSFFASCGATLCLLTGLLTFSRGGAIAISTAVVVAFAGLACAGRVQRQYWLRLVLPTLVTLVLLGIWGGERLQSRLGTLTGSAPLSSAASTRLELWQSHGRAIAASPWVGYGAATHEDIYPSFIDEDLGVNFTHGESGYLPIQLENGLLGTALLACAIAFAAWWGWQSLRVPRRERARRPRAENESSNHTALAAACLSGIAASAVQSVADFVWYIPACLTTTLMLLACLHRLAMFSSDSVISAPAQPHRPWAVSWLVAPIGLLAVAVTWGFGPARTSGTWDRYQALRNEPSAESITDISSSDGSRTAGLPLIRSIVLENPTEPVARLRLATALLAASHEVECPAPAAQALRRAAIEHALQGLRTAPLRGEGYLVIASAAQGAGAAEIDSFALLKQAVRVRPSDMEIRLHAGLAAFRSSHVQWGFEVWKPMMESSSPKQNKILTMLASLLPAELLLNSFELDHQALWLLYTQEQSAEPKSPLLLESIGRPLVRSLVEAAENTENRTAAAGFFSRASSVHQQINGEPGKSLELAMKAVEAAPSEYKYRVRLMNQLIRNERWEDAEHQLRWCQTRKPRHPQTLRQEELMLQAVQRR